MPVKPGLHAPLLMFAGRGTLLYEIDRLRRVLNAEADSWSRQVTELHDDLRQSRARESRLAALLMRRCAHCEAGRPTFRGLGSMPAIHPLPDGGHAPCGLTSLERELVRDLAEQAA